jgi:hypothetical protein
MHRGGGGCIDALESIVLCKKTVIGATFLAAGAALLGGVEEPIAIALLALGVSFLVGVRLQQIRPAGVRPPLKKNEDGTPWCIDDFHDGEIRERFGFDSRTELHHLMGCLNWPAEIVVGQGEESKRYKVSGQQALLYMLERDHCATKLSQMEFAYGDSYNSIDEQALAAERWLVTNHGHRLEDLAAFSDRFGIYAEAIRKRITANHDQVPPQATRLVGFVDRCSIRIARPSGNWHFQKLFFNWKSQYHCLAYQSLYAPDGMHMHVWGPLAGRHNDRLLMGESGLNALLEDVQRLPDGTLPDEELLYGAYTDRGYDDDTCIRAAYHGPNTTPLQLMYNNIMSPVRVAVEWGFARVRAMSKLLHSSWNMRLQAQAVDVHVKAAILLANARTTLRGAQTVSYFQCVPPTLEDYFA